MNADFVRYRGLLAVAVGAGVMLGAAGIFLYHQLFAERRRTMLQRDLARIDGTVAEMRLELDTLRRLSRTKSKGLTRRNKARSVSTTSDMDADVDMYSAISTEDDDEFFDFSDDDDMILLNSEVKTDPRLAQLFSNVDQLLKGAIDDKRSAYSMLLEHQQQFPPNASLLWRLAKASHCMATECNGNGDFDKKKEYVLQGCSFAQQALELDDSNPEAHKWFAVLVGSRGEFMGMKEKIEDGFVFKQHVDRALSLQPDDPSLHHLLGRFKYEVATLSWIERKVAGTLFAEPPAATYSEALADFLRAENMSPTPWKENLLFVAKCYVNQGELTEAVKWLDRASKVDMCMPEDESVERELQGLLSKYGSYRKELWQ